jgi:hypothetical protein
MPLPVAHHVSHVVRYELSQTLDDPARVPVLFGILVSSRHPEIKMANPSTQPADEHASIAILTRPELLGSRSTPVRQTLERV